MEQRNYVVNKRRVPAFICRGHARRFTQTATDRTRLPHGQDVKDLDKEKGSSKKTVTMAPTSMYLTGRSLYTARKPLISAEHQTSILKNPLTQDCSETVHVSNAASNQKESEWLHKKSDNCISKRTSTPKIIAPSLSSSREDLSASLSLSDLRLCSSDDELNFSFVPLASKNTRLNISSPVLDDLSLTESQSRKWISTQETISHSYTFQTRPSQKTKTFKQERDSLPNTRSSLSYNKGYSTDLKHMSPYQANYWACAIPSCLPPSPDRKSPSWDPDREYQTLLDYTYPIRPNTASNWQPKKCKTSTQTNLFLPDSGIELDSFLSCSSLSCLDPPGTEIDDSRCEPTSGQSLYEFHRLNQSKLLHSKSSDLRPSSSLYSSVEQVGLSVESLDCEEKQSFYCKERGIFPTSRSAPNFIRSTCILPHPDSLGDWDEEFLRLPRRLQELQDLSDQLKNITEQIGQPVKTGWQLLERESASVRSSAAHMEKQAQVSDQQENEDQKQAVDVSFQNEDFSEQLKGLDDRVSTISSELYRGDVRKVEAIMNQIKSLSEFQRTEIDEGEDETKESLLQHLKAFCSNLEQLIQWLYKVVEKMEVIPPNSVDIESVKASLADYESFQKEVQAHRPLTASVLQTGEILLFCMNSASPFLKETLMLIERQSDALETHSEHLFYSILSTIDHLKESNSHDSTEMTS
ncbi:centrosomal protein of 68 kDa [Trichomycterus rosablanca]|uniref:centrosomal protein of 68 kDa n=1 Tax=Trichomycterus rosablanca TaxID=2290929 RepID=UPI002F34F951